MCKSLELIEELEATVTKMHYYIRDLRGKQNDLSLMRQDIQHQLENEEVDSTNAYNLSKAYHLLSKERRIVTDEIEILQDTLNRIEQGFGHIVYYKQGKQKEYEFKESLRKSGSESYNPRRLDLSGNVLKQVKKYLSDAEE